MVRKEGFIPPTSEARESFVAGARMAITGGRNFQFEHPEIADDYRSGLSYREIVSKYSVQEKYHCGTSTALSLVRFAIVGYKGGDEYASDLEAYDGLITDPEELKRLAKLHNSEHARASGIEKAGAGVGLFSESVQKGLAVVRSKVGNALLASGRGIHEQSREDRVKLGRKSAEARGQTVLTPEQIDFVRELMKDANFLRGNKFRTKEMAVEVNNKYFEGRAVVSSERISTLCTKLKKAQAGEVVTDDSEE